MTGGDDEMRGDESWISETFFIITWYEMELQKFNWQQIQLGRPSEDSLAIASDSISQLIWRLPEETKKEGIASNYDDFQEIARRIKGNYLPLQLSSFSVRRLADDDYYDVDEHEQRNLIPNYSSQKTKTHSSEIMIFKVNKWCYFIWAFYLLFDFSPPPNSFPLPPPPLNKRRAD